MKFEIFAPSYKRAGEAFTQQYLPECTYVVSESEADAYRENGHRCWVVPDSAQGNLCRVRNYILDNAKSKRILLLDDDLFRLQRWQRQKIKKLTGAQALEFIEHGFNLAEEWGVKFWGINCVSDKAAYREYMPFSLSNYIGGPFQAFIDCELRYDESLPLKEDYDMTLQVCNRYRKALRFNQYNYIAKQHTNTGGCAAYRTMEREQSQFKLLQKKWGSEIVRMDDERGRVNKKRKTRWDINPVIKIPIPGV